MCKYINHIIINAADRIYKVFFHFINEIVIMISVRITDLKSLISFRRD